MRKLICLLGMLCVGCLQGCMPTEQSEQQRWKQATEIDAANRAVIQADMKAAREASEAKIAALSQQMTKEHGIQTPEHADALAGAQAQFAAQAKAIADAALAAIADANKAADDRIAAVVKANMEMPKAPMVNEAWTALTVLVSGIAGMFGGKLLPTKTSSIETKEAIAAIKAKVGIPT